MFQHNLDPILLSIFGLEIRYYGLVYVLGFLALYFYLRKNNTSLGFSKDDVDNFVIYFVLGIIIGSRIFTFLVWNPSAFLANPLQIFYIWQGGMSYHGALLGGIIAGYFYTIKIGASFYKVADKIAVPALLFLGLGRVTNFINAELVGTITDVSWCVEYPNQPLIEGCRHPYQLYEAVKNFLLFFVFFAIDRIKEFKTGALFLATIIAYNFFRFFIDFYREDPAVLLGLSTGQILCMLYVIGAAYFITKLYKK